MEGAPGPGEAQAPAAADNHPGLCPGGGGGEEVKKGGARGAAVGLPPESPAGAVVAHMRCRVGTESTLRSLEIWYCKQLVGYAQAPAAEPSATLESSIQLLPSLESLKTFQCESMVEVFKLPASLRKMEILDCSKLKSIFSRRLQQEQATSSNLQGRPPVYSELSSSSAVSRAEHSLFPCLESIYIRGCESLTGVLDLLSSLKEITVSRCGELRSVESHSGSLLEKLKIGGCKTLSSLPDGPQAYGSLKFLILLSCPGIKRFPKSLQQRLRGLEFKCLDARYEGPNLLKPKTWRDAFRGD